MVVLIARSKWRQTKKLVPGSHQVLRMLAFQTLVLANWMGLWTKECAWKMDWTTKKWTLAKCAVQISTTRWWVNCR